SLGLDSAILQRLADCRSKFSPDGVQHGGVTQDIENREGEHSGNGERLLARLERASGLVKLRRVVLARGDNAEDGVDAREPVGDIPDVGRHSRLDELSRLRVFERYSWTAEMHPSITARHGYSGYIYICAEKPKEKGKVERGGRRNAELWLE
ncbi:unnamed protein product, partial [Ixodes pacificus]